MLTNVSTKRHHESKHRGCLLQVQTIKRRHTSFNAPSYERPQTQIRFARPFPARKVLGFRKRQAQTQLPQQGTNRTADSRKNGGIQRPDCRNDRPATRVHRRYVSVALSVADTMRERR